MCSQLTIVNACAGYQKCPIAQHKTKFAPPGAKETRACHELSIAGTSDAAYSSAEDKSVQASVRPVAFAFDDSEKLSQDVLSPASSFCSRYLTLSNCALMTISIHSGNARGEDLGGSLCR